MPKVFSKPPGSERSDTARGFRTPQGDRLEHTPRGGRSDRSDGRRGRDDREKETRDRMIEDAFRQPLEIIRPNVSAFVQALIAVLRKNGAVQTDDEYAQFPE